MQPIEALEAAVRGWLIDRELDRDARFYRQEVCKARGEKSLADPSLVLVFEDAFYAIMG